MESKKKVTFLTLIVLVLFIFGWFLLPKIIFKEEQFIGMNCKDYWSGLCVEFYFVKYVDEFGDVRSDYNQPTSARYGDYLRVEEIKIFNSDNKTLKPFSIDLTFSPKGGYKNKPRGFGEFRVDIQENLTGNSELIIKRKKYQLYEYFLNEEKIKEDTTFYDIELNELGEWETKIDIKDVSHTTLINERYHGDLFVVVSPFEVESAAKEDKMLRLTLITLIILVALNIWQIVDRDC